MGKLEGKTALITGGTSGIGLATAELFLREGARLLVAGRSQENAERASALLGGAARTVACDSGRLSDIEALLREAGEYLGSIDVLFLNAAVAKAAPLEAVTEADFDEIFSVDLKGVFFTLQKSLPLLAPGASIIVTTSIANRLGSPNFSVYAAAKAALRSLVQSLALELVGRGYRINAVCPGPIDTPMFERLGLSEAAAQAKRDATREKSPSKRFGSPDEVAKVVLFLASGDSSYIVGEEIVVDGGMSLL